MPYAPAQRRFLGRTALFFVPFAASIAVVETAYWRIGENLPLAQAAAVQAAEPKTIFLRRRFPEQVLPYKLNCLARRQATIVAVGSSRIMNFRSEFFGREASHFYNFGTASNLRQTQWILDRLPQNVKLRVLYAIDPWWFNKPHDEQVVDRTADVDDAAWSWKAHATAIRISLSSDRRRMLRWLTAPDPYRLGVTAQEYHTGFRPDGSLHSGRPTPTSEEGWTFVDRETPPVYRRVLEGLDQFVVTDRPDERLLARLDSQLQQLRRNGTLVIGFFPPMSKQVHDAIRSRPQQAAYAEAVRQAVPKLFLECGFPFFDVSSTADLGLDDRYLTDGFHAEETFAALLLQHMLGDARVAEAFPDAAATLRNAVNHRATNPWYLGFSEDE